MKPKFIIPSTSITKQFVEHLSLPENKRILFSARFGSGKSFFLSEFFEDNDKYIMLKLHPVDYTVSSNEDIFEVVKHDLLIQIVEDFSKEIDLQKEDVKWLTAAKLWIDHKMDIFPFLGAFAKMTEDGEKVVDAVNNLRLVFKEIDRYKKELNVNEEELLINYLVKERTKVGSVREIDGMTSIINEMLDRIKSAHPNKELILVLDDMDRLDPEHIFRLFNIFTAHYDSRTETNKFGFDKILFVCDIQNIEHIFLHKYGKNVDFEGYVNKFYSREIFRFDFRKHLKESLVNFFVTSMGGPDAGKGLDVGYQDYFFGKRAGVFSNVLSFLIGELIAIDAIKARSFTKLMAYDIQDQVFQISTGQEFSAKKFPFFSLVSILKQFFSSVSDLQHNLNILSRRFSANYNPANGIRTNGMKHIHLELIGWCIPFMFNDDYLLPQLVDSGLVNFEVKNEKGEMLYGRYEVREFEDRWLKLHRLQNTKFTQDELGVHHCHKPNPFYFFNSAIELAIFQRLI